VSEIREIVVKILIKYFGTELFGKGSPETDIADEILSALANQEPGLIEEELQKFTTGSVDYPRDAQGEYDWTKPEFTAGNISPLMREIAKAAIAKATDIYAARLAEKDKEIATVKENLSVQIEAEFPQRCADWWETTKQALIKSYEAKIEAAIELIEDNYVERIIPLKMEQATQETAREIFKLLEARLVTLNCKCGCWEALKAKYLKREEGKSVGNSSSG
jgi:hypothetical protein